MDKKTNINRCPLCGARVINRMYGLSGYFMCNNCLLGWKKIPQSTEYLTEYYEGKSTLARNIFTPLQNFFYSIRQWYAGRQKKKLWIDVGAGDGAFLKHISASNKIGVEISRSGRSIMENSGLKTLTDGKFLKTKRLNADVISFWHVLEHVDKPWDYLSCAKRNLKNNGHIVIGVPNLDSFEAKLFRKYWFHLVPKYHQWYFSPTSMQKLLEKTGFKIEKIDHWSLEHNPTGILQSFINWSAHSDSVLHRLIKRGMNYKLSIKDIFWSVFWLTIGLPIVFFFWLAGVLLKMPGTFVVVAVPQVAKNKTRESLR